MEDVELRIKQFMSQLTDLTYRYKLKLLACGCCDGINIEPVEDLQPGMVYDCSLNREWIVVGEDGMKKPRGPVNGGVYVELEKTKDVL